MKSSCCYTMFNTPINSSAEHIFIIVVKTENKTAINHDAKTMQSIWLFVSSALPAHEEENKAESERAKAKRLAHSFLGAFSASRTDEDWKKVKEDYLVSKYASNE